MRSKAEGVARSSRYRASIFQAVTKQVLLFIPVLCLALHGPHLYAQSGAGSIQADPDSIQQVTLKLSDAPARSNWYSPPMCGRQVRRTSRRQRRETNRP